MPPCEQLNEPGISFCGSFQRIALPPLQALLLLDVVPA
jgi:hypothetical protein